MEAYHRDSVQGGHLVGQEADRRFRLKLPVLQHAVSYGPVFVPSQIDLLLGLAEPIRSQLLQPRLGAVVRDVQRVGPVEHVEVQIDRKRVLPPHLERERIWPQDRGGVEEEIEDRGVRGEKGDAEADERDGQEHEASPPAGTCRAGEHHTAVGSVDEHCTLERGSEPTDW